MRYRSKHWTLKRKLKWSRVLHKLAGCGGNILRPQHLVGEGRGVQGQHGLHKALLQICPIRIKQKMAAGRERQLVFSCCLSPLDVLSADHWIPVATDSSPSICDASFLGHIYSSKPWVSVHARQRHTFCMEKEMKI